MKKIYLLKTVFLLCALVAGSNVWAEEVTGTINFGSGSGSTNVNSASVTGSDSNSNTWTVTTEGTTSFTPTASFAQIGSSKSPATSITFTTTLPNDENISTFSAKFGGYSGTAGTVTLKVDDTTVGTGSLNATNDVTVNSITSAVGKVLTVTVTGISKGVKAYNISYSYFPTPSYTITATSNNTSYGTVSVSGDVITATPFDGYRISTTTPYEVTNGEATVAQSGNEFTVTASSDCTIQINFEAIPTHTVTWIVNGTIVKTEDVEDNTAISFFVPSSGIPTGYMFIGWSSVEVTTPQVLSPSIVTEATCTTDVTYYAVVAAAEGSPASLTKMTSSDTFADNDKIVVVVTDKTFAMYEETINTSYVNNFTFDGKVETINADSKKWWTVTSDKKSGWYLGDDTDGYLYSNSSNNLSASTVYKSAFTLSWNTDKNAFTLITNNRWLSCRTDLQGSNKNLFRLGGTTDNSPSGNVYFDIYKYVASTYTYSNYCTTIPTATITLNAACTDGDMVYGTYSNSSAFVVSEDIVVSEVGVVDGKLIVSEYETGDVVPANTGVMVSAMEGGDYTVNLSSETGTSVLGEDNMLRPTGEGITAEQMTAKDANCQYYRLTMQNGETIGFWWGAEDGAAFNVGANKAYLAVPETEGARMSFWMGNESSGIADAVRATRGSDRVVCDLQGRRVKNVAKGLYIVDGKKVLVK